MNSIKAQRQGPRARQSETQSIDLHQIVKITPTMYVTKHGMRFRKGSLNIVGADTWGPLKGRIRKAQGAVKTLIVTDENVAAIESMLKEIAK